MNNNKNKQINLAKKIQLDYIAIYVIYNITAFERSYMKNFGEIDSK